MSFHSDHSPALALDIPVWIAVLAFGASMAALAGGYWDDAWHTERGRDEFFIAPHIAIYAGIAVAGMALSGWALLANRAGGIRTVWAHKPLALALLSVAVTLASGPIDNFWHAAFGRDSVIWSPPHMLGIVGTLGLGAALLAEFGRREDAFAVRAAIAAGALVLASATFAVVEYETDVPQFDELWYLPVLGLASAIGLSLVRLASPRKWAATEAATVHTVFIVGVSAFLLLVGFPPPALPLLIVPAVLLDQLHRRRWPLSLTALAYTVALYAVHVAVRNGLGDGVRIDAEDVVLGLPLTWAVTALVFAVAAGRSLLPRRGVTAPTTAAVLAGLVLASAATAHDPGQGKAAGSLALTVSSNAMLLNLRAEIPRTQCAATQARRLTARRAGLEVRGALTKQGCRLSGRLRVPERGRWFVYAELERSSEEIEAWLPISVSKRANVVREPARYAYFPPDPSASATKIIAGVMLYAAMLALLFAITALIRASRRRSGRYRLE